MNMSEEVTGVTLQDSAFYVLLNESNIVKRIFNYEY